jgi:hypothetical protein
VFGLAVGRDVLTGLLALFVLKTMRRAYVDRLDTMPRGSRPIEA